MKHLTIGSQSKVISYSTKQQGYGRQSLRVTLHDLESNEIYDEIYVGDVFPNVREHFERHYRLRDDVIMATDGKSYIDPNIEGMAWSEDEVFDTMPELLTAALAGKEVEIREEEEE